MTISLYFGPYNDPGDANFPPTHHWDWPHAPDCHNPAFTITRSTNPDQSISLSIALTVRNITNATVNADFVKLYAAACGLLNSPADVNLLAGTILSNAAPIHTWSVGLGDSMAVPARSDVQDSFWSPASGAVAWGVPPYASGFILVAVLQAPGQLVQNNYTGDPSVAIWLG